MSVGCTVRILFLCVCIFSLRGAPSAVNVHYFVWKLLGAIYIHFHSFIHSFIQLDRVSVELSVLRHRKTLRDGRRREWYCSSGLKTET